MGWGFEEIERDWLAGGTLAFPPDVMVAAFDRADRIMGAEWLRNIRKGGLVFGSGPTFEVVSMGVKLAAIEDLGDTEALIDALRNGDKSAEAELTAIYLLRHDHKLETELYPEVAVGAGVRVPDFRIRSEEDVWVYVEVTQAGRSDIQKRAEAILDRLADPVSRVRKSFALEVSLKREPTDAELDDLYSRIVELCQLDGKHEEDVPGLAHLIVGTSTPGLVIAGSDLR